MVTLPMVVLPIVGRRLPHARGACDSAESQLPRSALCEALIWSSLKSTHGPCLPSKKRRHGRSDLSDLDSLALRTVALAFAGSVVGPSYASVRLYVPGPLRDVHRARNLISQL